MSKFPPCKAPHSHKPRSTTTRDCNQPQGVVALDHFGHALYELTLEIFGQVPEAQDGLEGTHRLLLGIAADLRTAEDQLTELVLAAEESEIVAEEMKLRRGAARLAPRLRELGAELIRTAQDSPEGLGGRP